MPRPLLSHLLAGFLALLLARVVSLSAFVATGVEFVLPLGVILLVHIVWVSLSRRVESGFARMVLGRTLATTVGISVITILAAILAPMPAAASGPNVMQVLGPLLCLAVLSVVLVVGAAMVALAALCTIRVLKRLRRWLGRGGDDRHYELGSLALAVLVVGVASLEGVRGAYSFPSRDRVSATVAVSAAPARVWQEVGHATSPEFPLPAVLRAFPQPVAVIDGGAALGAQRIVHFKGREGEGDLVLQVVQHTDAEVVFQAVADTTPLAKWVRQGALTFHVVPVGTGSSLTVSSDYDRLLAPAWFFQPYIRLASFLAVDVLARDTAVRSERGASERTETVPGDAYQRP